MSPLEERGQPYTGRFLHQTRQQAKLKLKIPSYCTVFCLSRRKPTPTVADEEERDAFEQSGDSAIMIPVPMETDPTGRYVRVGTPVNLCNYVIARGHLMLMALCIPRVVVISCLHPAAGPWSLDASQGDIPPAPSTQVIETGCLTNTECGPSPPPLT